MSRRHGRVVVGTAMPIFVGFRVNAATRLRARAQICLQVDQTGTLVPEAMPKVDAFVERTLEVFSLRLGRAESKKVGYRVANVLRLISAMNPEERAVGKHPFTFLAMAQAQEQGLNVLLSDNLEAEQQANDAPLTAG